jgi:protein Mpv17
VILVVLEQVLSVDVGITRGWSAIETANRVPLDNWRAYSHVLHSSPVATKAITSGAVYAIGDVLSQRSSSSLPGAGDDFMGDLDRGRVLRSLVAGFVGHGPMSHVWYHVSEAFFDDVIKMQHVWYDFVPKVILDQAIFGPIWNNSYILLLGVMQLHRPGRIWDDMKRTTLPLILKGLKLWPFVHVITYGLIPVENRLLWVDAVEIVWVTILASTASSSPPPPGEEEEEEEEKEDKI